VISDINLAGIKTIGVPRGSKELWPPKFQAHLFVLCFERRGVPVVRLTSKYLAPPNFGAGHATVWDLKLHIIQYLTSRRYC